jgi:uncharacterized damage-inducible protein DinB
MIEKSDLFCKTGENVLPEVESYLERIEDVRGQVIELITGLSSEALNWRPVEGEDDHVTNSLAVMASHVAGAEHFWIHEAIGRNPPTRQRDQEFITKVDSPIPMLDKLKATATETQQVFSALTNEDLNGTRHVRERTVPVRWAILHVIDHTSLHLGHMQITYQLWRSGQGVDAPRWFQRLKGRETE